MRSLYQCLMAKVDKDIIYCKAGHKINTRHNMGVVRTVYLERGCPLIFKACQQCKDFDDMGKDPKPRDKGYTR